MMVGMVDGCTAELFAGKTNLNGFVDSEGLFGSSSWSGNFVEFSDRMVGIANGLSTISDVLSSEASGKLFDGFDGWITSFVWIDRLIPMVSVTILGSSLGASGTMVESFDGFSSDTFVSKTVGDLDCDDDSSKVSDGFDGWLCLFECSSKLDEWMNFRSHLSHLCTCGHLSLKCKSSCL